MTRKEALIWMFYGAVLILLFLASSTDLLIKEREDPVYPVSVVIEDSTDEEYANFRRGLDLASMEFNVDLSFITLYEKDQAEQQMEMLRREQQDGAAAVILAPVDEEQMDQALNEEPLSIPLVLWNAETLSDRASALVSVDCAAMGRKLAEQVMERHGTEDTVLLFASGDNSVRRRFQAGIEDRLSQAGYRIRLADGLEREDFRQALEALLYPAEETAVVVALDQKSLRDTADLLRESPRYRPYVKGLYGRGTSIPILNALDQGWISGLMVTDGFSAGYLCVKQAVGAAADRLEETETVLDSYYIQREDLRDARYEKMLYPIE